MSRPAYPAFCEEAEFISASEAAKHYEAKGFGVFDQGDGWTLMRRGVLEAYIRPMNKARVGWLASVVQLAPEPPTG